MSEYKKRIISVVFVTLILVTAPMVGAAYSGSVHTPATADHPTTLHEQHSSQGEFSGEQNEQNYSEHDSAGEQTTQNQVSAEQVSSVEIKQIETRNFPDINVFTDITNSSGEIPRGLDASDFRIAEDGRPESVRNIIFLENNTEGSVSTALVIDRSGSMGGSKIQGAKSAASTYVDSIAFDDEAEVISFANGFRIDQRWTRNKSKLQSAIQSLSAGGGTRFYDATIRGINQTADREGRSAVIALTDGADTSSTNGPGDVIAAANRANVTVFTIGLGSGANDQPLQRIADQTGGEYYPAPDPDDLERIYTEISGQLRQQYLVQYTTTNRTRDGGVRSVDITVESNTGDTGQYRAPGDVPPVPRFTLNFSDRTVQFNANSSFDPNGQITEYRWDFENDGAPDAAGVQASFTYPNDGRKEAKLTVVDNDNNERSLVIPFNLSKSNERNLDPEAAISVRPASPVTNEPVTLSAADSLDPNGDSLSYQWDIGANGTVDATGEVIRRNFTEGTYAVGLNVSDGTTSNQTRTTFDVVPESARPNATFDIIIDGEVQSSPFNATAGQLVTFDATGSDSITQAPIPPSRSSQSAGQPAPARWQFENQGTKRGGVVSAEFAQTGTQTISLTVTGDRGVQTTIKKEITIEERNRPVIDDFEQPSNGIIPQAPNPAGILGFPNTWEVQTETNQPLESVTFSFPGVGNLTDDTPTDGDASVQVPLGRMDELTDGEVTVTATNLLGRSTSKSYRLETFDLPDWGVPYRSVARENVRGGIDLTGGGQAGNYAGYTPTLDIGFFAGEIEVSAGAATNVTYVTGTRRTDLSVSGSGGVTLTPAVGVGGGVNAILSGTGETELEDDALVVNEVRVEGDVEPSIIFPLQIQTPVGGVGAEARFTGVYGATLVLDTSDNIEVAGGSFTEGFRIVPLEIGAEAAPGGIKLGSATLGGEVGLQGTVGLNRQGFNGEIRGTGQVYLEVSTFLRSFRAAIGPSGTIASYPNSVGGGSPVVVLNTTNSSGWEQLDKYGSGSPGADYVEPSTTVSSSDADSTDIVPLTANRVADRKPALLSTDDGPVAVWAAQQPNKSMANGTDLVLRNRLNGTWGSPVQLTDDNRYESFPDIASNSQQRGFAWAQANQSLDADELEPFELPRYFEITVGTQSNGSIDNQTQLSQNDYIDLNPTIVGADENWLVAWIQDRDNNLSTTDDRRVRYFVLNEDFSEIRERNSISSATDVSVSATSDTFQIAAVDRAESSAVERAVTKIRLEQDGSEISRTRYPAPNATEVAIADDTTVWLSDRPSSEKFKFARNGVTRTLTPDPAGITDIGFDTVDDKRVLTYTSREGNPDRLFYHVQRDIVNSWSGASQIHFDNRSVARAVATPTQDGLTAVIESSPSLDVRSDIFAVNQSYAPADLNVSADVSTLSRTFTLVDITVANDGSTPAPERTLRFTAPTGDTRTASVPDLEPGEEVTRTVELRRQTTGVAKAVLSPRAAPNEQRVANNADNISFGTDLSVERVTERLSDDRSQLIVDIRVRNNGPLPAQGLSYGVRTGNETRTAQAPGLGVGQSRTLSLRYNFTDLENSQDAVAAVVPTNGSDTNLLNNERETVLRQTDVGISQVSAYGPVVDGFGRQASVFVQSGDTGNAPAEITFETPAGNRTYSVPVPAAQTRNDSVSVPVVMTIPGAATDQQLRITTDPATGLDTAPTDNLVRDRVSQPRATQLPTLNLTSASGTTLNDNPAVRLSFANPESTAIAEIVKLTNGSRSMTTDVVVGPQTTRNTTIPVNMTGNVTVTTISDTTTVPVDDSNDTQDEGPPPVVGTEPPTDPDDDGLYEDLDGSGDTSLRDVVILFNEINSAVVQNNAAFFNFDGRSGASLGDVVALFNQVTS